MPKAVFYQSVGPELNLYDIDVEAATLTKRGTATTPDANVQYVWPHPSKKYLYAVSSNGGPGTIPSTLNTASAFRVDPASGMLTPHGAPVSLPTRPLHCTVDATGSYLLTAYNHPSGITVHRIRPDGTIGDAVPQPAGLDLGIFAHQIMITPGNRGAILVTRGNNPESAKPEDPGALKVFGFDNGVLNNRQSIAPGTGLGFGPRHLDFHPTQPWVFVSVERQSMLFVYRLETDGSLSRDPLFTASTLRDRKSHGHHQMAGAIHVHPSGRFVTITNRNSGTEDIDGKKVLKGDGENGLATFSIDPASGEPTLLQNVDLPTIHPRTFGIDPSGRMLVAASVLPVNVREAGKVVAWPAALCVYRIGGDGKLTFARKYDVDTGKAMQFWSGMITLA